MITMQRGFQANSRIITTTNDLLGELVNLARFGEEFAWVSVSGVLYLVLLLSLGALGFTGWLRSRVS